MRICHMSTVHPPTDPRVVEKMVTSLAVSGHEIHLIVQRFGGPPSDVHEGINFHWLPSSRTRAGRAIGGGLRTLRIALRIDAEIYHFHDPELVPIGIALAGLGRRVVYDVHEDLPAQILNKEWIPKRLRPLVGWGGGLLDKLAGRYVTAVAAVTPPIAERFPPDKTFLLRNYPIVREEFDPDSSPWADRVNQVIYAGTLGEYRGIFQMIDAIERVPESLSPQLLIAGRWGDEREAAQTRPGWARVAARDWLSRDELNAEYARSRVGIHIPQKTRQRESGYPTKMFEFMEAGIPAVVGDAPLARRFVEEHRCGIVVDPTDVQAIAEAIEFLFRNPGEARDMGRRGWEAVRQHYSWQSEAVRLERRYELLVRREPLGQDLDEAGVAPFEADPLGGGE